LNGSDYYSKIKNYDKEEKDFIRLNKIDLLKADVN
jgi:hypothetical protein